MISTVQWSGATTICDGIIIYTAAQEIALGFLSEEEFIGLSCQSLARIVSMENCAYVYKHI